ncbi:MAG: ribosome small subunit-dependent GTPase A [Ignavibacteria bacterium]
MIFLQSVTHIFERAIKGLVTKIESKDYYVLSEENETFRCALRGKLKKEFSLKKDKLYLTGIAVVGDTVEFEPSEGKYGAIHSIDPRRNYISRKAPKIKGASYRGERLEQIIAANIDQVFIQVSIHEPDFNNRTLDRLLVAVESSQIDVVIVIHKSDLDSEKQIKIWEDLYKSVGYKVIVSSVIDKNGIDEAYNLLRQKKTLFFGQSGVGKSSLLNILYPELNLKIGDISDYTSKGTHTTVTSVMIPVGKNTYIIDTPGVREIDPFGIRKEDLHHYFIDFNQYQGNCKFNTCIHDHEPECAVIEAVENGEISELRYESYLRLLNTIEEDIHF